MASCLNTSLLVLDPNIVLNFGLLANCVAVFQHDDNVRGAQDRGVRILEVQGPKLIYTRGIQAGEK